MGKVPLPGDLIIGGYYPWLDYNWGYPTGVPVKNPITSDAISFIYPMRMAGIELLKNGHWPLWNPYLLSGTPLLANFQSAPFSPTNIFYFAFDHLTAWSVQIIVQHVLAAGFVYLLLRSWNISQLSAVFGGVVYAFTGFNLLWSQWNAHTLTASFIPLLLLFADKFLKGGNFMWVIGLSFVVGLQFLSGYPQIIIYTSLALFCVWIFRFQTSKEFIFRTLALGLFAALGIGIAALQILPGYELITFSQRAREAIPIKWVFLDWREIILFVAPDYYGNHATQNYWGHKNYLSTLGFVGVANLILAGIGLGFLKVKREVKITSLIGVFGLLLAFQTPVSNFLWEANFLGYQAGVSYRSLVLFCLSVSLLAGFGLDRLRQRLNFNFGVFLIPGLLLFGFGAFAALHSDLEKFQVSLRNLILPGGVFIATLFMLILAKRLKLVCRPVLVIIVALSVLEMFYFGWKFTPFTHRDLIYPETPVISYLKEQKEPFRVTAFGVMPVNQGMPYQLEFPGGYDAVYPYPMAKYIGVLNSNNPEAKAQDRFGIIDREASTLLDITNTKYILAKNTNDLAHKYNYKKVFQDKSVNVFENPNALPRTKIYFDWETVAEGKVVLEKLLNVYPISRLVIIDKDLQKPTKAGEYSLVYEKYTNQESIIKYESTESGVMFIAQQWYPGWQVFVDGQSAELFKTNYAFSGVYAPQGEHSVRLVYSPDTFRLGLKISAISVLALFILGVIVMAKRRSYT